MMLQNSAHANAQVCLDLLSDYNGYFHRSGISKSLYGGWSNAYRCALSCAILVMPLMASRAAC